MRTVLLVAIAISAAANWWSRLPGERRGARTVELITKPATTVLVILLVLTADAPSSEIVTAAIALTLCLAGDIALLGPPAMFVVGLALFAVAHLAFIALFADFGMGHPALAGVALIAGALLAGTTGRVIVVHARARERRLGVAVTVYLCVIVLMATSGWATGRVFALIGTTAFVVSDTMIGWNSFVGERSWRPLAIMVTYHVAIVSLALAV